MTSTSEDIEYLEHKADALQDQLDEILIKIHKIRSKCKHDETIGRKIFDMNGRYVRTEYQCMKCLAINSEYNTRATDLVIEWPNND